MSKVSIPDPDMLTALIKARRDEIASDPMTPEQEFDFLNNPDSSARAAWDARDRAIKAGLARHGLREHDL